MSIENPLESIRKAILFSSNDYSQCKRDAWIYGIVVGWPDEALQELAQQHRWEPETIERLKRLNKAFVELNKD